MITEELIQKIETLSHDEYRMVEIYVDNLVEFLKRREKAAAWDKIKADLERAEKQIKSEGTISYKQLREELGV